MDKHRNGKIALRKLYCDHRQMLTDCLPTSCIRRLVAMYLDSTTVNQEMKMVSRFLVTETHPLITTGVHACSIVFITRRRLLGYRAQAHGAKYKQEKEVKTFIAGKSIS
jgi:hypothetical protein